MESRVESVILLIQRILQESDSALAIKALLLIISGGLGWLYYNSEKTAKEERKYLTEQFQNQISEGHKELIEVIEKYQDNSLKTIEAINEIKILVATIGSKI